MIRTKNIAPVLAGLIIAIGAGIVIAHAQTYTPLAPLPGTITAGKTTTNISDYLAGMIKLLIALGAAMAILFAIIGGTQYVAASINPAAKKDAMERIQNALIGLAIMLTSYLLLLSINPELVGFKLALKKIELKSQDVADTNKWPDDTAIREELKSAGVHTNRESEGAPYYGNCKKIGDTKCTSLAGLPRQAIDGVIALKKACTGWFSTSDCAVVISGGTEPGHETHGLYKPIVDLSTHNNTLNNFIISKKRVGIDPVGSKEKPAPCGVGSAPHYFLLNAPYTGIYVRESNPDHWHVCY